MQTNLQSTNNVHWLYGIPFEEVESKDIYKCQNCGIIQIVVSKQYKELAE